MSEKPYIEERKVTILHKYNPNYGDDRLCKCGHPYYRHFDSYDENRPVGCKYCQCHTFEEENEDLIKKALELFENVAENEEDFQLAENAQDSWTELKQAWKAYTDFLKGKYPAEDGKEWEFTCPHHQKIDSIISKELEEVENE